MYHLGLVFGVSYL